MPETVADPFAALLDSWKQTSDAYMAAWTKALESLASPGGEATVSESVKTYAGTQATLNELRRTAFEPLVELAGGVPLSEFRRLMDMVYAIHLRLDLLEDAVRELRAAAPSNRRRKREGGS